MESVSYQPFRTARPVWPLGQETAFNVTCRFHAAVPAGSATLYLTASTLYRLFVNGTFVAYGPARGPKDYYRVDELDLTPYLTESENVLAIEVFGYNANSYYTLDQSSFLQAEVRAGEAVLAATGADSATFLCVPVPERTQKVQRYSFQRPFAEHWTLTPAYAKGLRTMPASGCALAEQAEKALLPRRVSMPELARFPASEVVANGSVVANAADPAAPDKVLSAPSATQKAWPTEELTVRLSLDAAAYAYTPAPLTDASPEDRAFPANSYAIYRFAFNQTGFLTLNVRCDEPVTLVALFDELLLENDVDWTRLGCCNVLRFDLAPGSYSLLSAEANTMGAMKLVALGGACTVEQVALI
jgi:alpha-L-rhamnosidase